jgi:hypothetical protein
MNLLYPSIYPSIMYVEDCYIEPPNIRTMSLSIILVLVVHFSPVPFEYVLSFVNVTVTVTVGGVVLAAAVVRGSDTIPIAAKVWLQDLVVVVVVAVLFVEERRFS